MKTSSAHIEEVRFGESAETEILKRWALQSKQATGVAHWLKSYKYSQFDFAGFSAEFIPLVYLEVKRRRCVWGEYGDVMFPISKHVFAKRLARNSIGLIGVTHYSCGTVVEVDLSDEPNAVGQVVRKDRGNTPVKHGFWLDDQLMVYPPGGWKK